VKVLLRKVKKLKEEKVTKEEQILLYFELGKKID